VDASPPKDVQRLFHKHCSFFSAPVSAMHSVTRLMLRHQIAKGSKSKSEINDRPLLAGRLRANQFLSKAQFIAGRKKVERDD